MATTKTTKNSAVRMAKLIEDIAKTNLGLETLETRKSDRLDFREYAVWTIKAALEAAYKAGAETRG